MYDLHRNLQVRRAISPVTVSDNTAQVSQIIDRQGFYSLEFYINNAALVDADATFTVLVEEGSAANLSDAAAVVDADLLGLETTASFTFADDNSVRKIGYRGAKRYVRLTITPANNTAAATLSAIAVLGDAADSPVA